MKLTSYAVGQALLMNPEVGKALVEAGHEVARYVIRSLSVYYR